MRLDARTCTGVWASYVYVLTCDWEGCDRVIAEGAGQPSLFAKPQVYCDRCLPLIEDVERRLREESVSVAMKGAEWLAERRKEMMQEVMPAQRGGTGSTCRTVA